MTTNRDVLRDELIDVMEGTCGPPGVESRDLYRCIDEFLDAIEDLNHAWLNSRAKL